MRPHGKAIIDPDNPARTALCQRCGTLYNLVNLRPQMQWAGLGLIDTGFRVCSSCLDVPNPNERTLIIPPDPPPSFYALQNSFPMDDPTPGAFGIDVNDGTNTTFITVGDASSFLVTSQ